MICAAINLEEFSIFFSVALCSYNGEEWISTQLDSILAQTHLPDEIVVVDDGSSDKTLEIITEYQKNSTVPIHLHQNESRQGVVKNFERCLSLCKREWVALCDQDDIWLPEKLEIFAEHINSLTNKTAPTLIYSDALVVDDGGQPICQSLNHAPPNESLIFSRLVLGNFVTGCTAVMNRRLLDEALPLDDQAFMHDWWLALWAAAVGQLIYIDQPLVKYRQHAGNTMGARVGIAHQLIGHPFKSLKAFGGYFILGRYRHRNNAIAFAKHYLASPLPKREDVKTMLDAMQQPSLSRFFAIDREAFHGCLNRFYHFYHFLLSRGHD